MPTKNTIRALLTSLAALGAAFATTTSRAGDESLVQATCSGGALTVTAASPWHTNKSAPWKWDRGSKVAIDEHAATFKGSACAGTVKAFICNGDQCKGPIALAVK